MRSFEEPTNSGMLDATCVFRRPMIRDWGFYFKKEDGLSNRLEVMEDYSKFWLGIVDRKSNEKEFVTNGKFRLGGKVFGHEKFLDDDRILTSYVKSFEIIEHKHGNTIPRDLICVKTNSGSKYYIDFSDYNIYMALMIYDMINLGKLRDDPGYYLKPYNEDAELL